MDSFSSFFIGMLAGFSLGCFTAAVLATMRQTEGRNYNMIEKCRKCEHYKPIRTETGTVYTCDRVTCVNEPSEVSKLADAYHDRLMRGEF